jgi:2-hydroxycyclohexanecarboxyl-CoA dehydrogenase
MAEPGRNRVAIVTGAARPWGVGRATALALAGRGYDVAVVDLREDWGAEAAEAVAALGQGSIFVRTDVSKRADVFAMVDRVVDRFGRIDALLNVAGINEMTRTEDFTDDQFHRIIGVNLLGPMLCAQAVVPAMKARGYGRIVSAASTSPWLPPPPEATPISCYVASKGGLIAWTKTAALELAPYGIVTNVVAIGGLANGMGTETAPDAQMVEFMEQVVHGGNLPWGRAITSEETGALLAEVAAMESHALLGATIHASGGRIMPL